ncbi:peptide chain release factor N(5)-glutamine methyltransferase [Nonlabens ponticola]|uniref:peptide chain release factor N(5)-glutamine methyltransferase n=1 Tax=Nonlabens ponticola TaxID=2496866 RepID=A0A3S9MXU0_9FLAO|nr:peptide chain release factor N(5)-glutamine methyltransferase [Nonlabens ponticola]AZQ44010.1 peptide chain release factor N(5)-glutamine methyltransferase [Nonlabens ponticola]
MTLQDTEKTYRDRLQELYPVEEIDSILKIVCEDLLNWSRADIMIRGAEPLTHLNEQLLLNALAELETGKPVQHITGKSHFSGHVFTVNDQVLIPRQETEELVDWVIKDYRKHPKVTILDIGTGSGCIGISLAATLKESKVTLADISPEALKVAMNNSQNVLKDNKVEQKQLDILQIENLPFYDVIVSNPPYVRELEKSELHTNVLDHDPSLALFVPNSDALKFYSAILKLAKPHFKTVVYFEINQYLGNQMKELAASLGFEYELRQDLNRNDRMMKCWQEQISQD